MSIHATEDTEFNVWMHPRLKRNGIPWCWICNQEVGQLATHIWNIHNKMTPEEYYLKYVLQKSEFPKCMNPLCNKLAPFHRFANGFNKYCSHSCRTTHWISHDESKAIVAENLRQYNLKSWADPEYRKKKTEAFIALKNHPDYRARMNGYSLGGIHISPKVGEIHYRSSWELEAYKLLDSNCDVIHYESETIQIPYWDSERRKMRTYYPDINVELSRNRVVIEIKPESQTTDQINLDKFESAREFCSERRWHFMVFTESNWKDLEGLLG